MVWFWIILVILNAVGALIAYSVYRIKRRERRPAREMTRGGMGIAAQVNGPQGLPEPTSDEIAFVPNTDEVISFDCGHEGPVDFEYDLFGDRIKTDTERMRRDHRRCPECIVTEMRREIIRCVVCGHYILPGQGVAVYDSGKDLRKEIATCTPDGGYIGCLRWDCCPSGGFFAGHWLGSKGFLPAYEHGCAAAEVMATGKPVMVGDTEPTNEEK